MLRNVFLKSLHDQRRSLLGWGVGIAVLVLVECAIWPSLRDIPNFEEFVAGYPEAMRKMFNIEEFTTGTGFLNAELFSAVLPALFLIFAIGRGARAIAGEEESGTLDVLLVTPVSPRSLLVQQAMALAVSVLGLGVVLYVATLLGSAVFGMGIGPAEMASATLAMVLLGIEFGWLALAVGAASGRRALAVVVAAAAAVGAYVLHVAGALVPELGTWQPFSPFHQALNAGPLGGGLPASYLWMVLAGVLFVAAAGPVFDRRDIGAR